MKLQGIFLIILNWDINQNLGRVGDISPLALNKLHESRKWLVKNGFLIFKMDAHLDLRFDVTPIFDTTF